MVILRIFFAIAANVVTEARLLGLRWFDLQEAPEETFQRLDRCERRKALNMIRSGLAQAGDFDEELQVMGATGIKAEIEALAAGTGVRIDEWLEWRLEMLEESARQEVEMAASLGAL